MPTTSSTGGDPNLVAQVVAEWRERLLQGERFEVQEYIAKYPDIANELRELFPAIVLIEDLREHTGDLTGSVSAGAIRVESKTLERLGDFRIIREIGRGGMGIVYEAEQESLGRRVALKVLPAQALLDEHKRERFQREAKAAARMHHTNIVPVYGVGEQDGLYYYVMQFIQGLGLDAILAEIKNLRRASSTTRAGGVSTHSPPMVVRHPDLSAVDVAQSLLSGVFAQAPSEQVEAPREVRTGFETVTLTRIGPPQAAEEPCEMKLAPEAAHVKQIAKTMGVPPRKPPGTSSSAEITEAVKKSTLTETVQHYWLSVARIGMQVAEALDYAHSQGVLHRDIKPSNLLLDTHGTVWVTDFGLAKATTEGDDLTHTGDIVGTLRYMAPERFSGISDTRCDIYSLGLTLYEMLVEQPAYDETDRGKLIRQVTTITPPRPRKLNPAVPRDLETIVLKATDREPARRYTTARALADDLKRFVEDKPIKARQASQAERLWRWCRRNPVVAGLSAAILALLVGIALASTAVAFRFKKMAEEESFLRNRESFLRQVSEESRKEAETNLQEAQRQKQRAEENLHEAQRQKKLAEENFHKARRAVDDSLTRISESKLLNVAGLQPLRKELLDSALKYYQGFLEKHSDDPALQRDLATAYTRVAKITEEISSKDKALEAYQQALNVRKKILQRDPGDLQVQAEIAFHHQAIGRLLQDLGKGDAALNSLQEASTILRGLIPQGQDKLELLNGFAKIYNDIGILYIRKNEPLEAMSYYTAALKLQRQLVKENPQHPRIVQLKYELANQLNQMGRLHLDIGLFTDATRLHGEALTLLKELVAANPQHELSNDLQRALATSHESLGDVQSQNDRAAAPKSYQEALPIREQLARNNPAVTDYQSELAHTYAMLGLLQAQGGELAAAVDSYQRAIDRQRFVVLVAPEAADNLHLLSRDFARLGEVQRKLGQRSEALRSYREARSILEKLPAPAAGDLYELASVRAACGALVGKGELTAAEQAQRQKDTDLALVAFRKAVATGFRDLDRVQKDSAWDGLRELPDFERILGQLKAKVKILVWNPDFEAAKTQAAREKKDLFVYFTGSDWCGWCLLVRRDVFGKDAFIDYVQRHFVLVELDFPQYKARPKNYAQNLNLFQRWGLHGFPSLILADAQGRPYANLRDGQVRDVAADYIRRMEQLRQVRVSRDELLTQALTLEGLERARCLDKALSLLPAQLQNEYREAVTQICDLDPDDKAKLRSKYLTILVDKGRSDVQEAMRKQDWDGTILKIDKILEELKPTGKVAADMLVDRARAQARLKQWDKAEADYAKALELKPDDADLRLERGQFYQKRGQPDKAALEFEAAVTAKARIVAGSRKDFDAAPQEWDKRNALSDAYMKLAHAQQAAGRVADAVATAHELAKLWPGECMRSYNVACELALCIPLVGKNKEQTAEQEAQRRQLADEAMQWLRLSILEGNRDLAHMQQDTDLTALRDRDDFKALMKRLAQPDAYAAANESRILKGHTHQLIETVAVSADNRLILSSGYDNTVRLWDMRTGKEIRRFVGHKGLVHGLAFTADSKRVVTSGSDGTVRLWEVATAKEIRQLPGHKGAVRCLALSSDDKLLLTGGGDKTLRLWEVDTGKEVRRMEAPAAAVLAVAFAPDGRHALSGGGEAIVSYWDVQTGKVVHRLEVPHDSVLSVALSHGGQKALAGTRGGFVYLWDLKSGRQLHRLDRHWLAVRGVGFTVDGRRFLSGNIYRGLILADVESGRELYRLGPTLAVDGLAVTADGRWVVTASNDSKIHIWTLAEDVLAARTLAHEEKLAEAEAAYSQILDRRPDDGDLRGERARFYARQKQWDKAIADYTELLKRRSDDPDSWVERARCYASAKQWDKASSDFDKALALLDRGAEGAEQTGAICNELAQQNELFDRVVQLRPKATQPWLARLEFYATHGQWKQAAAVLVKLTELDPADHYHWFQLAPVYLELGDTEGYRRVCREMIERFREAERPEIVERTAKTCLLLADSGIDRKLSLQLAERAAARGAKQANAKWFHLAMGMADYRDGQYARAVDRLGKSLSSGAELVYLDSLAYLFLAMAHARLGEKEETAQSMYKVRFLVEERLPKPDRGQLLDKEFWSDWLRFQIIRREAEALLKATAKVSRK
jgi:serine/threonine-protein kinase